MEHLAAWLAEQGLDQGEFARRMGVHQSSVSRWIAGLRDPSLPQLRRIAALTGLSLDKLAAEGGKPKAARKAARPRRRGASAKEQAAA